MIFIKWPDFEFAKSLDKKYNYGPDFNTNTVCLNEAEEIHNIILFFFLGHIFWCFVTFYREIYEAKVGFFGSLMRFMEVIATGSYMVMVTKACLRCVVYLSFD